MKARLSILALLTVSCAFGQKVTVEFDQAADFSRFHTFGIRHGRLNSQNPLLNTDAIRQQIESDIGKSLTARGLTKVIGPADLNVRYTLGPAPRTALAAFPASWTGLGTQGIRLPFTEGTLVIDLRDPTTRSLVWRGISAEDTNDAAKVQAKLDDMVRKAIDKFPPKK
jgi:hypothetical protein